MIIIGIDPGYERLGIAIIEKSDTREKLLHSDCFRTDPSHTFHHRILLIGTYVEQQIALFHPDHLALETVYFNTNQKTAMDVAAVRGVLLYTAQKHSVETFEYTPPQIKAAVGGSGKASKKEVEMMLHHLITIPPKKKRLDDEYDAIAIALTHSACTRR